MLAGEVMEGETLAFDKKILLAFRKADDPSQPIGPAWMTSALLDLTALGGPTVIALVVLAVVGFLVLQTRYWTAFFIFMTAVTGEVVSFGMKGVFARPRPAIVATPARCVLEQLSRAVTRCSRPSSISPLAPC